MILLTSSTSVVGYKLHAAHDNNVEWDGIFHDTRDAYYRSPGWGTTSGNQKTGAVPVGTAVTLRLRSYKDDLTSAAIRIWDGMGGVEKIIPMQINESTSEYDYWEGIIQSPAIPDDYYYNFILTDGSDTDYYNDDSNLDGGSGKVATSMTTDSFAIVFYDPNYKTPAWHKKNVGYQIFIDRFFNGDPSNDAQASDILWYEWDSNGDGVFTSDDAQREFAHPKSWDQAPGGGGDYFGGDFAGVQQKIDYLSNLGIGEIWFNPWSESPDNHGYSVDNYRSVDPYYGVIKSRENGVVVNDFNASIDVLDNLISALNAKDINVFYDTVINHVSAQSVYFQRYEHSTNFDNPSGFAVPDLHPESIGAYENPYNSPYYDWFKFYDYNDDYDGWWGFKNIPTLKYDQTSAIEQDLITGPNNLFKFWIDHGVKGFRLDVNPDYDDGQGGRYINAQIRESVKASDQDAVIMGEVWDRANTWLTGTMNDGVQNMPFRDNVITWLTNELSPDSLFENFLISVQENYPPEAFYSLWTILGNHDTPRILTSLNNNTELMKIAATLQFTYPGVPIVFYGDEVGQEGYADPDDRRPFPWGHEKVDIQQHYQKLIALRNQYSIFTDGGFELIPNTQDGVLSFARELAGDSAITIANKRTLTLRDTFDLSALNSIQPGDVLVDAFNNATYTVAADKSIQITLDPYSVLLLLNANSIVSSSSQKSVPTNTKTPLLLFPLMFALLVIQRFRKHTSAN